MFNVYTESFRFQITDMSVTRQHFVVFSKELFNRLRLGGRLHYYQIFLHNLFLVEKSGANIRKYFIFASN